MKDSFHAKINCHYQELSSHRRKKMDHDYLNYRSILIPIEVRQYAHSWVTNSPLFFFIFIFIVCVVLFRVRCFLFSKAYKHRSFSGDAGLVGCKSSTNFCLWALIFWSFCNFCLSFCWFQNEMDNATLPWPCGLCGRPIYGCIFSAIIVTKRIWTITITITNAITSFVISNGGRINKLKVLW